MKQIPFSPPYIDEDVVMEVTDTLRSGWITTGPKAKMLEQEIKDFTHSQETFCVNSWTSGAILILKWLGVSPGDEVIIPAYTYCATALAVMHAGATPVMVDACDGFNIGVASIASAITPRTKAIIPVDFGGYPCDNTAIMKLVQSPAIKEKYIPDSDVQKKLGRILVVSDAAHSLGAYSDWERPIGNDVDITIFSLHAVKNITTAEGGAICLNLTEFDNNALYNELRCMTLNCQTKDAYTKNKAGGWRYDIIGLGMKMNLADVNAAIGLVQIRKYPILLAQRKRIFWQYHEIFSRHAWAILPPESANGRETSYHLYPLRIRGFDEAMRDEMITEITKRNVAVNVHFIPLPMLSFFRKLGYSISDYPRAYKNYQAEISLPVYPQLSEEEVVFVTQTVIEAYKKIVNG